MAGSSLSQHIPPLVGDHVLDETFPDVHTAVLLLAICSVLEAFTNWRRSVRVTRSAAPTPLIKITLGVCVCVCVCVCVLKGRVGTMYVTKDRIE